MRSKNVSMMDLVIEDKHRVVNYDRIVFEVQIYECFDAAF